MPSEGFEPAIPATKRPQTYALDRAATWIGIIVDIFSIIIFILQGLGESPVPASSIVVSLSIVFLVYLCLVFRLVDIYMPVVECGYVPFFADVLFIYSCIFSINLYFLTINMEWVCRERICN
jgi:hypothetical protein